MEEIYERLKLKQESTIPTLVNRFITFVEKNQYMQFIGYFISEKYPGSFVRAEISINIPSLGVYKELDIRSKEKILIYFHEKYPRYAPSVMIEREDFPYDYIPHMNYSIAKTNIEELNLCLYRGNIDEWYSEYGVAVFLDRIISWFEDAVNGNLIKTDGFESIRYEGELGGLVMANYSSIEKRIKEGNISRGYAFLYGKQRDETSKVYYISDKDYKLTNNSNSKLCILITDIENIDENYISKPLRQGKDLKIFNCYKKLGHALRKFRNNFYHENITGLEKGIIVLLAVQRNQIVIGSDSNYEFIACEMQFNWESMDYDKAMIHLLYPIRLLNQNTALRLSGMKEYGKKMLIIGCGAIGSKVSINLAKMGYCNQVLVDNDYFLPHNVIRHEVSEQGYSGQKKSSILKRLINSMYFDCLPAKSIEEQGEDVEYFKYEKIPILDFTASQTFLYFLSNSSEIKQSVLRSEISGKGKLGITYVEGMERNPNLLEERIHLWYEAMNRQELSDWLSMQQGEEEEDEYSIGYGCGSDTLILDNATISNHASIIPHIFLDYYGKQEGHVVINYFDKANLTMNKCILVEVDKHKRMILNDNIQISISIKAWEKACNTLDDICENAGIWIGSYDIRSRELIIVDTFISEEHKRTQNSIICGYEDVIKFIKKVEENTNGLIGYVGEWHTHPKGSSNPSTQDLCTYDKIKSSLRQCKNPFLNTIFGKGEFRNTLIWGEFSKENEVYSKYERNGESE